MDNSNYIKSYREDVQWFYDRHPVAYFVFVFLFASTFFSVWDWFSGLHPLQPYGEHLLGVLLQAGGFAAVSVVLRRWRRQRRASTPSISPSPNKVRQRTEADTGSEFST